MRFTEPLWTAREIARVVAGRTDGRWFADGIAIDSREVIPGDLFVALAGAHADGHDFVAEALAAGAAGALVSAPAPDVDGADPRLIHVADTAIALRALGEAARRRIAGRVAAVTGSAGKTSVKEALRRALGRDALAHANIRSFNNHVGVPLSLARMPRAARYAVFELGTSAPGEIAPLSRLVAPDVAIVTAVGSAHAGAFTDERAIADEKAGIFEGVAKGGTAVLDIDHAHGSYLLEQATARGLEVLSVSLEDAGADIRPLRLKRCADVSCMTADIAGVLATVKVGVPGRHWVRNALLVLGAVKALGGDIGLAGLSLAELRAPAGRGRRWRVPLRDGDLFLIDDAYNANPLSLAAAFEAVADIAPTQSGRRIAVLADMAELGDEAAALHRSLAPQLARAGFTEVVAIGPLMAMLAEEAGVAATSCADAAAALDHLARRLRAGDLVLVKGANAAGLSRVVDGIRALGGRHMTTSRHATLAAE